MRLASLALVGMLVAAVPRPAQAQSAAYEELQRFSAVLNHIRQNYVDSVGYNTLVRAAIDGMLRSLDPHSWFAPTEDYERLNALERGELAVTGIRFELVGGTPTVLSAARESPAMKAGVLPGDRIVRIDGIPTAGMTEKSVALRLAGEKGSRTQLKLSRGSSLEPDTFSVGVKREFLKGRSVGTVRMLDSITGYVELEEFGPDAARQVRDAIQSLQRNRMRRLVLDLRGNPGGIVTEAVDLAAQFLPGKTLVFTTHGRRRAANEEYRTKSVGDFVALPLVVLVDEGSASASEALAASLQDHDRALVLGRRTFGKALMQTGFVVPSGFVMLTFGQVVSPSGRFIQRRYRGLDSEQYRALAGTEGEPQDTLQEFRTASGRIVRGGGGIAPDVAVPAPVTLPPWVRVASDSGFDTAVADSVAATLAADPASRRAWQDARERWQAALVVPFVARARTRLKVAAELDSTATAQLARRLAARTAFVRWPPDGGEEFWLRNDPDVQAAVGQFAKPGDSKAR